MNPAPEGQYLDLHTGEVKELDAPGEGFDLSVLPSLQVFKATPTTLTETLRLPSGTILQGAGMGKTVLRSNHNGMLITARGSGLKNIVIRDLTLLGSGGSNEYGMLFEYADNILVERCEILNIGRRGVGWEEGTTRFTFRYCVVDSVEQYHCLSCKDDTSERTRNFAVYSNVFRNAGSYGFDCHAEGPGEVCGNIIRDTKYGWKWPDSAITDKVLVHDNWVQDSPEGTKVDDTLGIGKTRHLYFYNNHMMPAFQLKEGVTVVAINNNYHSTNHRTNGATLITDPNAPEAAPIVPYLNDTPPVEPPPIDPPVDPPPPAPVELTDAQMEAIAHRAAEIAAGMVLRQIADALYDAAYGDDVPFSFWRNERDDEHNNA